MLETILGGVMLVLAGVLFLLYRPIRKIDSLASLVTLFVVIICVVLGWGLIINSCRSTVRDQEARIAVEHKGHEILHAQLRADLEAAEPGDIIEMSNGERMFIMLHRSWLNLIKTRHIYASAESNSYSIDELVLDHARVFKLGTPEHAAALIAEVEKHFVNLRQQLKK